jgi:hypothetical protein
MGRRPALSVNDPIIEDMVRRLGPVLTDKARAQKILTRYWRDKMALVWETEDVHRAANELELALTEREAIQVLQTLHSQHNAQLGLRWEDITAHIEDNVLGRKLTKREVHQFVHQDKLTIPR